MKKVFCFLFFVFLCALSSWAQKSIYVYWAIPPEYDKVHRISEDYFVCVNGSSMSLLDKSGKERANMRRLEGTPNLVTPFYEGRALILEQIEGLPPRFQLLGILTEDARVIPVPDDGRRYYVDKYPFFSDHRLPVYILEDGVEAYGFFTDEVRGNVGLDKLIKFDYEQFTPFSNGVAWVKQKTTGKKNMLTWAQSVGAKAMGGEDEGWLLIKPNGMPGDKNAKKQAETREDILRRYDDMATVQDFCRKGRKWAENSELYPDEQKGFYGYRPKRSARSWQVEPQFEYAAPFYGNHAIVSLNRKEGVLLYDESQPMWMNKPVVTQLGGGKEHVEVSVVVPEEFNGHLDMMLNDTRMRLEGQKGNTWTFVADNVKAGEKRFTLSSDGMRLVGQPHAAEGKAEIAVVLGSPSPLKANASDQASTFVNLRNLSDETIELNFRLSKGSLSKREAVLGPGENVRLNISFSNVQELFTSFLTIEGARIEKKTVSIKVIPFL